MKYIVDISIYQTDIASKNIVARYFNYRPALSRYEVISAKNYWKVEKKGWKTTEKFPSETIYAIFYFCHRSELQQGLVTYSN